MNENRRLLVSQNHVIFVIIIFINKFNSISDIKLGFISNFMHPQRENFKPGINAHAHAIESMNNVQEHLMYIFQK